MMLHLVEFWNISHFFVQKKHTIVTYDPVRHPKPNNYILLDEVCHDFAGGFAKWYSLCPLGEILCSHKDLYIPIGRWIDWSHQVRPLGMERPWGDHALQAL